MHSENDKKLLKALNELMIDDILEMSDEEVLSLIGTPGYPTHEEIKRSRERIFEAVTQSKIDRGDYEGRR